VRFLVTRFLTAGRAERGLSLSPRSPTCPANLLGGLQRLLARHHFRPKPAADIVVQIKILRWSPIIEADFERAALRHGFVLDDADGHQVFRRGVAHERASWAALIFRCAEIAGKPAVGVSVVHRVRRAAIDTAQHLPRLAFNHQVPHWLVALRASGGGLDLDHREHCSPFGSRVDSIRI
jgi:hypothetical protein